MSTLLIEGGRRLSGVVEVEGNKNAALPLLAACLLTREECVLTNVPRIKDVEVMAHLLIDLGAHIEGLGTTTLRVCCADVTKDEPDPTLVGRLRGSVLLLGPLLARRCRAVLAPPGGDFPARRTIATHLEALVSMGAVVVDAPGHVLELLSVLNEEGVPTNVVGVHFHDTYGQALANTYAALEHGVTTVDASAGGLGGCPYAKSATGNLATEDLVWMLQGLGIETGVDLGRLTETSVWMAERLGRPSPSRTVRALSHKDQ